MSVREAQRNGAELATRARVQRVIVEPGYLAAHPGGTVKIGEHLDARLSTRIDRLHVCDCSVIPEPWGLPPTLTLVGLGKHLARVLCGEKA